MKSLSNSNVYFEKQEESELRGFGSNLGSEVKTPRWRPDGQFLGAEPVIHLQLVGDGVWGLEF